jgi:gamma-glutamyltranspeptidase/glutathione hydrolase
LFELGSNLRMATDGGGLTAMGHRLTPPGSGSVGGFQSILVQGAGADRVYRAGSDHRKDGEAAGY